MYSVPGTGHTWHHRESPSTKLSLNSSKKPFWESQNSLLPKYRTNPGGKKPFMWPEIPVCEPRRGWKNDKLLPPAVGSFSATKAPANQIHSSQQKLQIISFFRGKGKKQPAIFIPRVGRHCLDLGHQGQSYGCQYSVPWLFYPAVPALSVT